MTRAAPARLPVRPGPTGVADAAAALRLVLAGRGGPLAVAPAVEAGSATAHHAAALTAALREDAPIDHPDAALVVATSGSTGEPQGVLLSAAALVAAVDAGLAALGGPGQWLAAVPVSGIGGLLVVARAVRSQIDPVVMPGVGGAAPFTPDAFHASATEALRRAEGSGVPAYVSLVPTQLRRLVADGPRSLDLLAQFRAVLVGGAAVGAGDRSLARAAGVALVTTYGATETCGGVVYDGVPLPGVGLSFLSEDGFATADGPGSIVVSGPTLALGYRLRPDLTERAFRPDGFHSADLGRRTADGIEVSSRSDRVVKVGGAKVSLRAVAQVLLSHPRVVDAIAVAEPDEEWGAVPVAYVVADSRGTGGPDPLPALLGDLVADRLGRHSRPRRIELVAELPAGHSGKPGTL
jgi:O-succinylbenzoic acid--CoA ligase